MNISEFADATGLAAHTLRYYEKIGLIRSIKRDVSGHRSYSKHDVDWVAFICRLKQTNMPLKQIQEYAELREQGSTTNQARRELLAQHATALHEKIEAAQLHLSALQKKIAFYDAQLDLDA